MNWIKSHKLIVILLAAIIFLLLRDNLISSSFQISNRSKSYEHEQSLSPNRSIGLDAVGISSLPLTEVPSQADRIVTQESNISLLVTDVKGSGDKILAFAKNNNGYMVYASFTRPAESPFANISIRIPASKLDQALSYLRSLAVKVTSENLVGTDVTEDYTDIEARLTTLRKTQVKFEAILDKAISVQETLTVQRELINLQDQIDRLIGQQKAIEKNAELTKITIYLSADELALPYTPDNAFRPNVVFKYAVRSLLNTLRIGAEALIWIAVYSPLVAAVILIYIFYKRWGKRRNMSPK